MLNTVIRILSPGVFFHSGKNVRNRLSGRKNIHCRHFEADRNQASIRVFITDSTLTEKSSLCLAPVIYFTPKIQSHRNLEYSFKTIDLSRLLFHQSSNVNQLFSTGALMILMSFPITFRKMVNALLL